MKRSSMIRLTAGASLAALVLAGCSSTKPEETTTSAAAAPAPRRPPQPPTAESSPAGSETGAAGSGAAAPSTANENYNIAFIQGVTGDKFYITMQCGIEEQAAKLGVTVDTQGPTKFDPTLQKPILDSVVASQPDAILIAPTDVTAMQGAAGRGRRCRHQDRAGRHHHRGPVVRRVPGRLRQRRRRRGGVRRDQAAGARRRQGAGDLHRPRRLHRRRPGRRLPGGGRRRRNVHLPRRAVLAQRPGHRRQPGDGRAAEGPRHRRHLRHQPVLRRRARRPASSRPARRTRSRSSASTPDPTRSRRSRTASCRPWSRSSRATIGVDGLNQAVLALNGEEATPEIQTGFSIITAENVETTTDAYRAEC